MNWREGSGDDLLWGAVVGFLVTMAVLGWAIQDYTLIPHGVIHLKSVRSVARTLACQAGDMGSIPIQTATDY